jgi:dTMP kinase
MERTLRRLEWRAMPFITFEGIEGSGKSTQARRLAEALGAVLTFEPGATPLGRKVRELLLSIEGAGISAETELLLFFADRAQHVSEVIQPALAAGKTVISDRYVDSTLAYQGFGRGLAEAHIRALAEIATAGVRPDLTFLLDVSVETGLGRVGRRGAGDRIEAEQHTFHRRVADGFRALAAQEPARWVRVDGERDPDVIAREIYDAAVARGLARHAVR